MSSQLYLPTRLQPHTETSPNLLRHTLLLLWTGSLGRAVIHSIANYLLCFYRIARIYPGVIFTFQPVHVSESGVHQLLRPLP
jgi:hypothetical protein